MNKNLLLTIVFSTFLTISWGQEGFVASGGDGSSSSGSLAYSVGQVVYDNDASGLNGSVNEGIQQPDLTISTASINDAMADIASVVLYPNPTASYVNLKLSVLDLTGSSVDLNGKCILRQVILNELAVVRKYMYLTKKATIQNIPTGTTPQPIISYDVINESGISINNTTGVITFNEAGVYSITAHTSFYAVNTGRKLMWFECVSTIWPDRIACQEMSGDANRFTTSFLGEFIAGDQITLTVAQQTGITTACPNTSQAFDETRVNIEKLF
jgi:hypothetical protein